MKTITTKQTGKNKTALFIGGGEFKQNCGFKNIIYSKISFRNLDISKYNAFAYGLLIFSLILGMSGGVSACDVYCSDCASCNSAINSASAGQTICLNTDIMNHAGTCIDNPANFNNKIFDCQGHTIDNNGVGFGRGIYLEGKANNTIKNCVITDFSHGLGLVSSSNNAFTNNIINNNRIHGLWMKSSSYNAITNNTANHNVKMGIYLDGSSDNQITDNTANDNDNGIYLFASSNNQIINNTANNNDDGCGIRLWSSSNNNQITSNAVNNNTNTGIFIDTSNNNTITNNTATYNGVYGISLYAHAYNNTIIGNTADYNAPGGGGNKAGIAVMTYSSNNILIDNSANSNGYLGIEIYDNANNNLLIDNSADSNSQYGILLGSSSSNNTLTANTASSNNLSGVYIYGSSNNNTLNKNIVSNNQYHGLLISDSTSTGTEINSNTFCSNNQSGGNYYDIHDADSNSGDNNACNTTSNWNDDGTSGCTYTCDMNIYNIEINLTGDAVNIIDPPLGDDVCMGETTIITANITINATNPNDPLLENISVCINVSCPGNYTVNERQYYNFSGTLFAAIEFTVIPPELGQCNVTTCVDCDNTINESDETDNCENITFNVIDCSPQPQQQPFPENAPVPGLSAIGLIILCILAMLFGVMKIERKN